mmetsp:Transcript_9230/g.21570  ORF Transcript_9230/g.21570 Transcript_9230/m.21570 type:complete len:209 (+) Transcript_9230:158-784(+)
MSTSYGYSERSSYGFFSSSSPFSLFLRFFKNDSASSIPSSTSLDSIGKHSVSSNMSACTILRNSSPSSTSSSSSSFSASSGRRSISPLSALWALARARFSFTAVITPLYSCWLALSTFWNRLILSSSSIIAMTSSLSYRRNACTPSVEPSGNAFGFISGSMLRRFHALTVKSCEEDRRRLPHTLRHVTPSVCPARSIMFCWVRPVSLL